MLGGRGQKGSSSIKLHDIVVSHFKEAGGIQGPY